MNGGKGKLFVSMSCFWIFAICILPCHQVWAQLPHPIDLVDVGATVPGFRLEGLDYYDWCGASVSGAGDVNGDGFADMIIGAYGGDPGGNDYAGETYLIYGSASGFGIGGVLDPSTLNGNNGVRLDGIEPGDYFGASVSGAGDVNGDGFADLLIGAQGAGITGGAYLVYGSASGIGSGGLLDVSTLDGANGVRLNGIDQGDGFGSSVSGAGDINGDGFADLLIGASGGDPGGDLDAGETYLVYGSASGIGSGGILDVATLDGNNGVRIDGIDPDDRSGHPVSGAGDINGDGFDDLLIAAHLADPGGANEAGETYLVYGSGSGIGIGGVLDLATLDGFNGVRLDGIDPGDASSGSSVSAAGDLNGDSYADFLIGASNADNGTGEAYLIYGSASGVGSGGALNLASLNGTNGVLFYVDPLFFQGSTAYVGRSVSSAGDVNGDGLADLLVGAPGYPGGLGPTFLVYGSSLEIGSGGALDLALLDGNNGIHLEGGTSGSVGYSVSGAGDVNGDGLTDLLVGAPGGFTGGVTDPGKSYLVLGSGTSTDAFYTTLIRVGDPPRQGIGMIGDWSHSIPMSRVWVDFVSGDNVSGDPSITTVTLQRLPSSSFAPLEVDPQYEWEIETDRVSYGSAAVTFKGSGERGETDWKALILITDDGGVTWYAPQIQLRNSLLHEITLPGESFPAQYALVLATDISAPTVVDAVYNDDDDDGVVEAGESVTLIMSSGVIVRPAQLSQTSFYLPVSGDSLGGAGFSVAANPNNTRQIVITLGTGASLTIAGEFNIANTGAGQPSGIDISDSRLPTAIQSLYGVKAVDGGTPGVNDSGVDILYT